MPQRSTVQISSKRFDGESLSTEHMAQLAALYGTPEVISMLAGPAAPLSDQAVKTVLERLRSHWDAHGFGPYVFFSREDRSFVGYAGLRHTIADGWPGVELLYAIHPAFWGLGVCTEVARVTVQQAFDQLSLRELVSFALVENTASKRVLEKLGFVHEKDDAYGGLPHAFYRLDGASFLSSSSS